MKNWYIVVFDLDRQPPGIEPQMAFALKVQRDIYNLGMPDGFAVFHKMYLEEHKFAFWFPPVTAAYYADFIAANSGEPWNAPPDDAECIGDETTRFIL